MSEFYIGLLLLAGTVLLYGGAEFLIRGGASLALRMGLPILVIGLTIMGYGTGTPELVVGVQASLADKGDIVVGNVLGSNIANMGLILGFAAICRPISVKRQLVQHDGPVMVLVSLVLCLLIAINSDIGRWKGFLLCAGLVIHTWWTVYLGKKEKEVEKEVEEETHPHLLKSVKLDLVLIIAGLLFLFFGGKLFLEGAIAVAKRFEISDAVIGLTVVAIGTSLPEFATSVVAMFRKHEDIALGNVVGSNIFNILAIVGIAAIINPIHLVNINWIDYSYMALLTIFLWFIIHTRTRITRWEGALMLISYFAYMTYLVLLRSEI